jgi:type IV secretion system protein VirB9
MKRLVLMLLATSALAACATTPIEPVAEGDGAGSAPALRGALVEVVEPAPPPPVEVVQRQTRRGRQLTPLQALEAANVAARQRPSPDGFSAARHVFTYQPGALYELYTSPNYVSTILLEPGETLNNIAAGDTSRWMVTEAQAETESEGRTIVLVKPQINGLRTNIVLITDRRTYLVEAISQAGATYSAQVAWSYPQNTVSTFGATPNEPLNFSYRIRTIRGRTPAWTPTRVFDNGRRTWIEFDASVAAADLPPVFVVTGEGAELVNYRVQGQRYMIDRVFDRAELRLGTRAPIIVRIDRTGAHP